MSAYAELHCRSNFSFLTGASHPEELVARAMHLGYGALAITDECSLSGVVRAHAEAKRCGLPLIIGAEMWVTRSPVGDAGAADANGGAHPDADLQPMRLVLLAQTRRGYGHLSQWITLARRRAGKGRYHAYRSDVEAPLEVNGESGLAGLPDCLALLVPDVTQPVEQVLAQAAWLKAVFGDRASIALELLLRARDDVLIERVRRVSAATGLPVAAAGDVLMHVRSRKPLQDTLTATRLGLPLAQCGWQLEPNAEQHLRPLGRLQALYEPAWLAHTAVLAGRCTFSLDELRYEYPREIVPPGATPTSHLRALTEAGALRRFSPERFPQGLPVQVRAQIEHELALIAQLQYEPYFLTVADIVAWARSQDILCQGRGSAANSTVCYCLHVTEVDPTRQHTLFERFISAERNEPPDIDIDFEHQRREEVIQYIYRKYGRDRAALTAVVISYRPRSALRDVGRALGLDLDRIHEVAKSQQWFDGRRIDPERLREKGYDLSSPITRRWIELTEHLIGFPRHLSQHPGGFVIARDQLAQLVPIENAAMPERSLIQWDKDDLDALGLLKVDILALGMLTALRRSLDLIGHKLGRRFELQDVPPEDEATYEMICRADTVGVFQIESRAQMSMLPRLKPRVFYDLVIEVAIVRPGPIQGGMVHPYLRRRDGIDPVVYPSPEIAEALSRTKGVPIFQEQVMQLAVLAADFTPGEADSLRRAMAAWKRKGGLDPFHERLVGRMVEKGYELEFAENIFKQIQGFGEYGFPESHAASFALLAYASSWIKRHQPDAFLVALLDSQPMGFYAPAQLVRDAREHGVQVRPVDVRFSAWGSSLEAPDQAGCAVHPVRLGLNRIRGMSQEAAERIVRARDAGGAFIHLEDLTRRADLDARDLNLLASADALRGLVGGLDASSPAGHRHQAAWSVASIDTRPTAMLRDMRTLEAEVDAFPLTLVAPSAAEDMRADYRSLGLTLNRHPLALLRPQLDAFRIETAAVLRGYPDGRIARASGLVTHRQRPGTAKGTVFVTLEDDTGTVNVIVWPAVALAQRQPLIGATLLTVYGQWQRHTDAQGEHAVMHLVATRLIDHTALLHGLVTRSRDFR
ncbi:MAG: error-prone DNA polymerase [Pseudomonadota bacterium]|nr:error-prone DNA polymerase [Pseudomonadota bacterium]